MNYSDEQNVRRFDVQNNLSSSGLKDYNLHACAVAAVNAFDSVCQLQTN